MYIRYRPRFFDQVGHQTMYASMGNKHFFSLNNVIVRQSRQKMGISLENKVL